MRREDFDEFSDLLDGVFDLIGKTPAAKAVSATAKALFFQALAEYPLPAVRAALGAHVKRGEFTPTPAAIIKLIEGAAALDTRPGPEEAWAIALLSRDEGDTIVWTTECAEAFTIARPVLDSSGPISGRKTFLEAYERLVGAARAAKLPAVWTAHAGWDTARRAVALQRAVDKGLLAAPSVAGLLPPPDDGPEQVPSGVALLAGPKVPVLAPDEREKARAQLAAVKKMILEGYAAKMARLDAMIDGRIQDEDEFKRTLAQRVAKHQAYVLMADQAQVKRRESEQVQQAGGQT